MSEDNWSHRSSGMRCNSSMWYVKKEIASTGQLDVPVSDSTFGRCRRHCPTMNGFPAVFGYDWCGDHKLDENKLYER